MSHEIPHHNLIQIHQYQLTNCCKNPQDTKHNLLYKKV